MEGIIFNRCFYVYILIRLYGFVLMILEIKNLFFCFKFKLLYKNCYKSRILCGVKSYLCCRYE